MDAYFVRSGSGWDMYCQHCADDFIYTGGDVNDIDGPYGDGGGEADIIHHCDCGGHCTRTMKTKHGLVGVCFHNNLTENGVRYTIDALEEYVKDAGSAYANIHNPEVLDVWANELRDYALNRTQEDVLCEYDKTRATEKPGSFDRVIHLTPKNQLAPTKSKKKHDNKVDSMMAFFGSIPAVSDKIYCKSCKDTGIIMLFNSSVKCADCRDM